MRRQPGTGRKGGFSIVKTLLGGAILAELCAFGVSYLAYVRVNSNRDTRLYLRDNYPSLLNFYYKVGETIDKESKIREVDAQFWTKIGK